MVQDEKSDVKNNEEKTIINPLSKKISKILDTRLENDKDTLDNLRELSSFFKENTLSSRRQLRGEIEKRSVAINEEFVNALKNVKLAVDNIFQEVSGMNKECVDMKRRLQVTKSETRHLIQQTNSLQNQNQRVQMQERIVKSFVEIYQLTRDELYALKGTPKDEFIKPEFFAALQKTQLIKSNTKYLLQTGHQKTALDIMEQMNVIREAALDRLFRWFKNSIRSPDFSPLVPQALAVFQDRKSLFDMLVDEFVVIHKGWLAKGFLDALTVGGPNGNPRPIELQAHEPLRYIGDMLAWIHQALPSEKEAAQAMFSKCSNIDISEQTKTTVALISESICRPLKSRIEQVIVSEQGRDAGRGRKAVNLYKISGLLHFYKATIHQVTGTCVLVSTIEDLRNLSRKMFLTALRNQVSQMCERVEPPEETLVPSAGVARTLSLLTEIVTAATVTDDTQHDFKFVIDCVVDPLVNAVTESGSILGVSESAVYLLNCLHQLHSTLSLLQTSSSKIEMIQGQIEAQLDTLSQEQIRSVYECLNLSAIYHTVTHNPPVPLAHHPSCSPVAIRSFLEKLDGFLSAPDHLMLPHTRLLLSSSFRKQLQNRTSAAVSTIYAKIYELVHDPVNNYPDANGIMPKNPETVRSLLF